MNSVIRQYHCQKCRLEIPWERLYLTGSPSCPACGSRHIRKTTIHRDARTVAELEAMRTVAISLGVATAIFGLWAGVTTALLLRERALSGTHEPDAVPELAARFDPAPWPARSEYQGAARSQ